MEGDTPCMGVIRVPGVEHHEPCVEQRLLVEVLQTFYAIVLF